MGTDSQISLNPLEDLRWLDYTQRMLHHQRNTFDDGAARLLDFAILNGRAAMGIETKEYFQIGAPLDAAVYDMNRPLFRQAEMENLLSVILYTSDSSALLGTMVNGAWVV